jgi:hypothetical protein
MKKFTYLEGTRREFSVAVTKLSEDSVLLTGMPALTYRTINGKPVYDSVVIQSYELAATREAQIAIWEKCGTVGWPGNNVEIVPAICKILNRPNPGIFIPGT